MKKHLSICAAREGVTDNGQIITFLDDFKYLCDIPFSVFFDFEITNTGGTVFLPKNVYNWLLSDLLISSVPKSRQNSHL